MLFSLYLPYIFQLLFKTRSPFTVIPNDGIIMPSPIWSRAESIHNTWSHPVCGIGHLNSGRFLHIFWDAIWCNRSGSSQYPSHALFSDWSILLEHTGSGHKCVNDGGTNRCRWIGSATVHGAMSRYFCECHICYIKKPAGVWRETWSKVNSFTSYPAVRRE